MSEPLSIASGSHDADEDPATNDPNEPPLEQKILETVKACPKDDANQYLVKPARLCTELGLSMDDANAELCGLLAAVGGGHEGASFRFETTSSKDASSGAVTGKVSTMVFLFPHDFESKAKRNRQKEDFRQWCWNIFKVCWAALKVLTAFGLILSLCILVIAAMLGIIAAIVAMSSQRGSRSQQNMLLLQLRSLFFTVRQLLWCYALFGQNVEGQDPFLGEMAHDMALFMSVCCGNPGSVFWWWRLQQMNRRRRRQRRGWSRGLWGAGGSSGGGELESEVEGVRLIRRGEWGQEIQQQTSSSSSSEDHRGLLSIAVEYLFGPSPFHPGPSETEKWKLRAAAIVGLSSKSGDSPGVSLQQLSPYTDEPPSSLDQDVTALVAGGLQIVAHFNGVPVVVNATDSDEGYTTMKPQNARFTFPELMGESQYAARYDGPAFDEDDEQDASWGSLLCTSASSSVNALTRSPLRTGDTASVPAYMLERHYKFTKLQSSQFIYCVSLGALNLIGVIWLRQSLEPPNGILQMRDGTLSTVIKGGLVPVLYFYAKLFFLLPTFRLVLIMLLNWRVKKRNERRKLLASTTAP